MIRLALGAYIALWVGYGLAIVGTPTSCSTFSSWLPVTMAIMLIVPAMLGYAAGREDASRPQHDGDKK